MKNKVRKNLLLLRKNLSKADVLEKSDKIKNRLFRLKEFKQASNILFYVSYGSEVCTHEMIKEALSKNKGVFVPVTNKKNKTLILSKLEKWDELCIGAYNILEPKKEMIKEISFDEIDLIIIPGIVFDLKGNRIGHGKGFYDRLLKNTKVSIIALAFEFQIIGKIPVDKHDKPVDIIITEKRIIYCKDQ